MSTAEERMQSAIEELEQENRLLRARNTRLEAELMQMQGRELKLQMALNTPVEPVQDRSMLECSINPRPLSHPLRDYHTAMSEGPLHYTWTDKPHRLVYDLIAAVKFYADRAAPAQEPVGDWVWSWIMDWWKRNGIAPATQDNLFEMVKDSRNKFDTTPPAQPAPVAQPTQQQIIAGAKALNKYTAMVCGVDKDDQWKVYGEELIKDATTVLTAAFNLKG